MREATLRLAPVRFALVRLARIRPAPQRFALQSASDNTCENCHSPLAWKPARFDHTGVTGNCFSCHNGTNAGGKNATHINSTNTCESCHVVAAWKPVATVDHTQVVGVAARNGGFLLQLRGEGPMHLMSVECTDGLAMRAVARFRDPPDTRDLRVLSGNGTLTVTVESDNASNRYQGIVPLAGASISDCLREYFESSEQLPTRLWLRADADGVSGLLLQRLPMQAKPSTVLESGAGAIPADRVALTERLIFNDRLDAVVTTVFASLVLLILVESGRHWWLYISGRRQAVLNESPFVLSKLPAEA